ncbi:hypothetical protein JXI42_00855 [bacterium]|nr:hypothetical protein [bacterium]
MAIEIIIFGIAILLLTWVVVKINNNIKELHDQIELLKKRISVINSRLVNIPAYNSKNIDRVETNTLRSTDDPKRYWNKDNKEAQVEQYLETKHKLGLKTVCSHCGEEYDPELDKCPQCHYLNVEKFGIQKKDKKD